MMKSFGKGIAATALVFSTTFAAFVFADEWPSRPITLIYPFGAGDTDILGRAVAETIEKAFGQPVQMLHKPGAAGVVGGSAAARARPDGYTFYYGTGTGISGVTAMYDDPPYDPINELAPVIYLGDFPLWLFVRSDLPYQSLGALVEYAKAHPGELNMAIPHISAQILTALFEKETGIKFQWINYKTDPDVLPDILGRRIHVLWGTGQWVSRVHDGNVRALVGTSSKRSTELPDTPTFAEAGLNPMPIKIYAGIAAPAGTPKEIIDKVNAALNKGMKENATFQKAFTFLRLVVAEENTPEDFREIQISTLEGFKTALPLANYRKR